MRTIEVKLENVEHPEFDDRGNIVKFRTVNAFWTITGMNVNPCANDVRFSKRTEKTDYVETMFRQRYGCTATVKLEDVKNEKIQLT